MPGDDNGKTNKQCSSRLVVVVWIEELGRSRYHDTNRFVDIDPINQ